MYMLLSSMEKSGGPCRQPTLCAQCKRRQSCLPSMACVQGDIRLHQAQEEPCGQEPGRCQCRGQLCESALLHTIPGARLHSSVSNVIACGVLGSNNLYRCHCISERYLASH